METVALLVVVAVVPYLVSVRGAFLFDDPYMFDGSPPKISIRYRTLGAFRHDARAMVHLFDGWLWRWFAINPTGKDATGTVITQPATAWHVLSLAFHVGTVLLVWQLSGLFLDDMRARIAAAVFAVHPLQVSAVGMVASRAGVQAAFFAFLGLAHASLGGWHWAAVPVCVYFSYKSKQDGLLYLALYPVVLWL